MTPAARIQATLDLLDAIATTPRPTDSLVSAYFRDRRYIGSKDRAAISTRLYAVLRHQARLDWWLANRVNPSPSSGGRGAGVRVDKTGQNHNRPPHPPEGGEGISSCRIRILLWLALGEQTPLTAINEMCSGGQYAPAPLTDDERALLRKIEGSTVEHPAMPEDVLAECPPDCADALHAKFGPNFLHEMRAMQEPATLDLRVNTLKATREAVIAELAEMNLKAELCPLSPWGVRLYDRPSLGNLSMLKDGRIEIQDEGSQLVALALDAKPGERVVDFCAGAGGKTLAIGAMMDNKGRISACDVMEGRLKKSAERFRRAGLHNIEIRALSTERDPWVKKHKGGFDRVLVDAPCSGTGTWRRNPDARWRSLGPGLEQLTKIQAEILDSAARLVKTGGRLVYATCSLLAAENEDQIEHFLATHPDFTRIPCGLEGKDYLALTPAQHHTDGFFAAALVKKAL